MRWFFIVLFTGSLIFINRKLNTSSISYSDQATTDQTINHLNNEKPNITIKLSIDNHSSRVTAIDRALNIRQYIMSKGITLYTIGIQVIQDEESKKDNLEILIS